MSWLSGLSQSDKDEMFRDSCEAFSSDVISENRFRIELGRLGYNATDIEDCVKAHRPPPPENDGD